MTQKPLIRHGGTAPSHSQDTHETLRLNHEKYRNLCLWLEAQGQLVVAFSGGVDSTFLMHVATLCLGDKAVALTVNAPYIAKWEIEETKMLSKTHGWKHVFLEATLDAEVAFNPPDRCYICKTIIFSNIKKQALQLGATVVADGSNADDLKDYRPGMRALKELDITSPLLLMGITKNEIRQWSRDLELETWDKPPYACLLTRLPYDTQVLLPDLAMIEGAETHLMGLGFRAVRVRKHGDLARIEIGPEDFERMQVPTLAAEISQTLKGLGFSYVTLDLSGYQMGSFNQSLNQSLNVRQEGGKP